MPREASALVRAGGHFVYEAIDCAEMLHAEEDSLPKDLGSDVFLLVKKLVK